MYLAWVVGIIRIALLVQMGPKGMGAMVMPDRVRIF
jgi:hypothetical protein